MAIPQDGMKGVLRLLVLCVACVPAVPAHATTFTVNSQSDVVDANPGDGICETAPGNSVCTLRAAVQEAGATAGPHTVIVPAGMYVLTATPPCNYFLTGNPLLIPENMSALCGRGHVTIKGAGSDSTIIEANGAGGATCCGDFPSARGMVVSADAVIDLSGVTIQHGLSNGGGAAFGGGGINNQGTLTISNSVFTGNRGVPGGGGIYNTGTLTVLGTLFTANSSRDNASGIYNAGGAAASITESTFDLNSADNIAAGIFNWGTMNVSSSTFSNNTAGRNGGAFFTDFGTLTLTNVTIANNTSVNAPAIWANGGTVSLENVTIAFNHASGNIGAVLNSNIFTLKNTIIAGNINDIGPPDCSLGPALTSEGHNLIGNFTNCQITGAVSTDIHGQAPGLAPLASNGGATQTIALIAGSPAIDGGDTATPGNGGTSCPALDQRGFLRPQGEKCDIGAFERSNDFTVLAVHPNHAATSGVLQAVISGSGFVPGATVKLRRSGQTDISANPVTVQDGSAVLSASFNLAGKSSGEWDLIVTNPDTTSVILPSALTLDATGTTDVWAELVGPVVARPATAPSYTLVYGNRGNTEALAVPVTFSIPTNIPLTIRFAVAPPPAQTGQASIDWNTVPLYVSPTPQGGQVNVPFLVPVIPPGFVGALPFTLEIPGSLHEGDSFTMLAAPADPLMSATPDADVLATMVAGAQAYAQANLGITIPASRISSMTQYASNQLQNAVANGRSQLAGSIQSSTLVYNLGQMNIDLAEFGIGNAPAQTVALNRVKVRPRDGSGGGTTTNNCSGQIMAEGSSCVPETHKVPDPDSKNEKYTAADCQSLTKHHVSSDGKLCLPNRDNDCSIFHSPFSTDPNCSIVPIKTGIDPNEKWGPIGPLTQHFRLAGGSYNYTVEFENLPTASVPAQTVVVIDQLDTSTLDLTTFSLGPISFGPYFITPPPGLQHFSTGLDLRPAANLQVKIDAGLDPVSGIVTWRFTSLDPLTGQATADPFAGFLPPDVTPPQGSAQLIYSVVPKAGLPSATTICNQASIVFDTNAAINTQNWCNTIDSLPPTSAVEALPGTQTNTTFPVQWSGTDAGSGIRDYSIYVSDNGGGFSAWLTQTTDTQANYSGINGHTYAFYTVSRDLLGNAEAAKTTADATTTVGTSVPPAQDFSVTASVSQLTIKAGQSGSVTFTVTPINGSTQSVAFACSDLPSKTTCIFAPATITLDGTHSQTTTVTIQTAASSTAASVSAVQPMWPSRMNGLIILTTLFLLLISLANSRPQLRHAFGLILVFATTFSISGCGGTSSGLTNPTIPGTPVGAYNVTISATASGSTHPVSVRITVN